MAAQTGWRKNKYTYTIKPKTYTAAHHYCPAFFIFNQVSKPSGIVKPLYSIITCLALHFFAVAQTTQTITYTINQGVPSNSVYRTIIDTKGFLWVATENGLARFDGKKFRSYTTLDGLTDNEIIDVQLDNDGTIWVAPFRGNVCYYNENKDRFEGEETNPELKKIKWGSLYRPFRQRFGGMIFSATFRSIFLFRDKKVTPIFTNDIKRGGNPLYYYEYKKGSFLAFCQDSIRVIDNHTMKYAKPFAAPGTVTNAEGRDNLIYLSTASTLQKLQIDDLGNITLVKEKKYPFQLNKLYVANKNIAATSANGSTYLINDTTLEIHEEIFGPRSVRHILQDYENNVWLSTFHEGLIKLQVKRISIYDLPQLKQNFNSILKKGYLYAGANNGEVLQYDGLYGIKPISISSNKTANDPVKRILPAGNDFLAVSQLGSFIFNSRGNITQHLSGHGNIVTKNACHLRDSFMLTGNHAIAYVYNYVTRKRVDSIQKRVVSLGYDSQEDFYIGSNDGLYLWKNQKLDALNYLTPALSYRVNTIFTTADSLVWVGLATDSLIVLNNNRVVKKIPLGIIIPGNICQVLYSSKPGEIWLGTNEGLNRINYFYKEGNFVYSNTYFGIADGLSGRQVNDISIENNTVYIATNGGISYLPENLQLPVSDISTFITGVYINNQQFDIKGSYELEYDQNNITINFSGVDLTGFLPVFEYSLNDGNWQQIDKIELKNLPSGNYKIKIRAIRRDGKPSSKEASINFNIPTPFWKSPVFWLVTALAVLGLALYIQQRRNKEKQRAAVERVTTEKRIAELEIQALKAQINPHFVFNCLNSIKSFIYDKDYVQADRYLDKFSELMRSTVDNSDAAIINLKDEIKYLDNYLQLEKLRFEEKFNYTITADQAINPEDVYVPAMLLQPYVENAIRHGMRFLENKKGEIKINVYAEREYLICEIDDNGIGREKAAALKSSVHAEYQGKGMTISKRRAELYNIKLDVIDKKLPDGRAAGTLVKVFIPLQLKP